MNRDIVISEAVDARLWPQGFEDLRRVVEIYGGHVRFTDLTAAYASALPVGNAAAVRFTGLSDGRLISLHSGACGHHNPVFASWDTLHLLGHMLQWSMTRGQAAARSLRYWGAAARAMSVRDFSGAGLALLGEMQTYELEANGLALAVFERLAAAGDPSPVAVRQALADMTSFMASDLALLTTFYGADAQSGLCEPEALVGRLRPISPPAPHELRFTAQDKVCVPVLHPRA